MVGARPDDDTTIMVDAMPIQANGGHQFKHFAGASLPHARSQSRVLATTSAPFVEDGLESTDAEIDSAAIVPDT
jgi:hypothetical protein